MSLKGKVQCLHVLENVSSCVVGTLYFDQGEEYMSKDARGIKQQCIAPYTPQQNLVSKRKKRSLMEMVRCMVKIQVLPHAF